MKQLFLFCLSLALLLTSEQATAAEGRRGSDAWKEATIATTIALNGHLNPFEIDVDVVNGVARLTGEVDEAVDKDLAEHVALGVDGIKEVKNEIIVVTDDKLAKRASSERQTFAKKVADATTTARVKSKLLWNRNTEGLQINVDTKNSVVTLKGEVETAAKKALAEKIAKNTQSVQAVKNELSVKDSSKIGSIDLDKTVANAKDAADSVGKNMNDTWITTKVKSTLIFSTNVAASGIDVSTNKGVVTLDGYVPTGSEKDLAEEIVKDVVGVKTVRNELTAGKS